jgi:hypothetical protein
MFDSRRTLLLAAVGAMDLIGFLVAAVFGVGLAVGIMRSGRL